MNWIAKEYDKIWFEASFDLRFLSVISTSNDTVSFRLSRLLNSARILNPDFLDSSSSMDVDTNLFFNRFWGFGSSSTLVSNVAYWSNTNPYDLLELTFGGSGYDIACARSENPVLYKFDNGPQVKEINFNPLFSDKIWFVYLGKKQQSSSEIKTFLKNARISDVMIDQISNLSQSIAAVSQLKEFNVLVKEHDKLVATVLGRKRVKEEFFNDFDGEVKSLGAWGGDFILASSEMDSDLIKSYFNSKGLNVIFRFSELVL